MQSELDREALYEGLKRARQPGRFEVISGSGPAADGGSEGCPTGGAGGPNADDRRKPLVIIDGAHNEAGAQALQETMAQHFAGKKILLVAGILADERNRFNSKVSDENHRSYHRDGAGQSAKAGGRKAGGACGGLWRCSGGRFGCRGGGASCKRSWRSMVAMTRSCLQDRCI